jgi:hypothetical protein
LFYLCLVLLRTERNQKKPGSTDKNGVERVNTEENEKSDNENESSTENYKVDHTEVISNDYIKGEPIELFDLMNLFIPVEGDSRTEFEYNSVDNLGLKWEKEKHCWDDGCQKYAIAKVKVGGNTIESEVSVDLIGEVNANVYKSIMISYGFASHGIGGGDIQCDEALYIDYSFPNKNYESKLLDKRECQYNDGESLYELKFPGKRTVWAVISYSCGSRQGGLYIKFYFNKEDAAKMDIFYK